MVEIQFGLATLCDAQLGWHSAYPTGQVKYDATLLTPIENGHI